MGHNSILVFCRPKLEPKSLRTRSSRYSPASYTERARPSWSQGNRIVNREHCAIPMHFVFASVVMAEHIELDHESEDLQVGRAPLILVQIPRIREPKRQIVYTTAHTDAQGCTNELER
jgi:hypothetical protein